MVHTVSDVYEAWATLDSICGSCNNIRGFEEHSVHVPGSWYELKDQYDWMRNGRNPKPLVRSGRTDYWEGLVHFCTADQFASIYADERVKASTTGYFKVPAVCLSEATLGNWSELQKKHGSFGYVFRKREVIAAGGGPALYIPQDVLTAQKYPKGFCDEIKPFVNLLRIPSVTPTSTKYDFLHEREWRVPGDITFDKTEPFGVIIDWKEVSTALPGWRQVFGAAMRYEELNETPK